MPDFPDNDTPPVLMTIRDTVRRFGISRSQLYLMMNDGRIKAKKQGRSTKIVAASVQAAIEAMPDFDPHSAQEKWLSDFLKRNSPPDQDDNDC